MIFLTTAEVAARWRMSPRTLEGWRDKGIGPNYHKFGGSVRYHMDEIKRFEEAWSTCLEDI
ncbi:helix-turn-helix domain-containing protein [Qipengyuania soli]|uniref:Helix-turn-helix domain-containing protein n=2 Tax=Qipengyuania soli TaxID=2782568 RepID=A0A7S8F2Y1_9SPHN|nr:helix-turn-helix domain-containing protein [Qipengyuania soli]QPC98172.1 helix-turn-helix domain-containing protein [Qipengyuania soli]